MGAVGNLIAGALGGAGGGTLHNSILGAGTAAATGGLDTAVLAGNVVGGGVAGAIVQIVVGLIPKKLRG